MKKLFMLFCIFSCMIITHPAQSQDVLKSRNEFKVDVDVAQFYGDSSQVFLELYYGLRENIFSYQSDSGHYTGRAIFTWRIERDTTLIAIKEWLVSHSIEDSIRSSKTKTLFGLQSVGLVPGNYKLTVICRDVLDSTRRAIVTMPVHVSGYPTDKECFSDIELCTSIQPSNDKQSIFYKNTLEVIPNPSRMYGTGLPIMYFYSTVYNLLVNNSQSNVIFRTSVRDAAGTEIVTKDKIKPRLYNASVEVGTFNLSTLRTGTYFFRVSLIDTLKNILASTEKRFYIYKYGSLPDTSISYVGTDYSGSRYAVMNEQDIDRTFDYVHYIASASERDQYSQLTDVKAKQKFLFDFWHRRDTDDQPMINEREVEYYRRVGFATDQYTSGFREGWKSDRGRVYIVYGPYDEIERFQSTGESNPYEIWHYHNLQGGVEFVFVDKDGMGNYMLVHSTHRDEFHDEDWYKRFAQKMR